MNNLLSNIIKELGALKLTQLYIELFPTKLESTNLDDIVKDQYRSQRIYFDTLHNVSSNNLSDQLDIISKLVTITSYKIVSKASDEPLGPGEGTMNVKYAYLVIFCTGPNELRFGVKYPASDRVVSSVESYSYNRYNAESNRGKLIAIVVTDKVPKYYLVDEGFKQVDGLKTVYNFSALIKRIDNLNERVKK